MKHYGLFWAEIVCDHCGEDDCQTAIRKSSINILECFDVDDENLVLEADTIGDPEPLDSKSAKVEVKIYEKEKTDEPTD